MIRGLTEYPAGYNAAFNFNTCFIKFKHDNLIVFSLAEDLVLLSMKDPEWLNLI